MKYLLFLLLAGLFCNCKEKPADGRKILKKQIVSELPDTVTITAVGDMMLGSAFPSKSNLPSKPDSSFKNVKKYLKGDVIFGNLEGCFLNEGKSAKCKDLNSTSCYAFRQPESYVNIYKNAGFNLLSLANNHVGDFGWKGRKKTVELLNEQSINFAGLTSHPYSIFEVKGVKYGFCAFAPNEFTVSINEVDSAVKLVQKLNAEVDIVIVSFHGGGEGAKYEHVTRKNEIFYKENRGNVYRFSHAVIDAGADIVLGHGPHVTRAVELYKNRLIAYSLGNFCTYGMFSLKGLNGIAPLLTIKTNNQGEFLYADVVSVKQVVKSGLDVDKTQAAFKRLKFLTKADFRENELIFSGDGRIEKKPH